MAGARPVERPAALAAELMRQRAGPTGEEELGVWTGSRARPEELECAWPAGEDELPRGGASHGAGEVADGWVEGRWAWRRTDGLAGAGYGMLMLGDGRAPDGRAALAGGVWLLRADGGMRALAGGVLVLWEMER